MMASREHFPIILSSDCGNMGEDDLMVLSDSTGSSEETSSEEETDADEEEGEEEEEEEEVGGGGLGKDLPKKDREGSMGKTNVSAVKKAVQDSSSKDTSSSSAKQEKKTRSRPPRERRKRRTLETNAAGETTSQRLKLQVQVKNVCTDQDSFKTFLGCLNVTNYKKIYWRMKDLQNSQASILFVNQEDAAAAQRILNNCSIGASDRKLSAFLQDRRSRRPKQNKNGKTSSAVHRNNPHQNKVHPDGQSPSYDQRQRHQQGHRNHDQYSHPESEQHPSSDQGNYSGSHRGWYTQDDCPQPSDHNPYNPRSSQTGRGNSSGRGNYRGHPRGGYTPHDRHRPSDMAYDHQSSQTGRGNSSGRGNYRGHPRGGYTPDDRHRPSDMAYDHQSSQTGRGNSSGRGNYRGHPRSGYTPDDRHQPSDKAYDNQSSQTGRGNSSGRGNYRGHSRGGYTPDDHPLLSDQNPYMANDPQYSQTGRRNSSGRGKYQGHKRGGYTPGDRRPSLTHSEQDVQLRADQSQHPIGLPRQPQAPEKNIPSLMSMPLAPNIPYDGDDDQSSIASGMSERSGTSSQPISLHVKNIDDGVSNDGFCHFLSDKKISFSDVDFFTSKSGRRFAIIHFASVTERQKARGILHNRWIFRGGPVMCVSYSHRKAMSSPSEDLHPPSFEATGDPEGATRGSHEGRGQGYRGRGCRNRGESSRRGRSRGGRGLGGRGRGRRTRNWRQKMGEDSDNQSECSEVRSICSTVVSHASSSQVKQSSPLWVTNIGENFDLAEFYDFLESLDLNCQCSGLKPSQKNNNQFAVLQFPDLKMATAAFGVLNNDPWRLGNDTPIKASFPVSKESYRNKKSGLSLHVEQLGHGPDEGRVNVERWLEDAQQTKDLKEESQRGYRHTEREQEQRGGRGQGRNGRGHRGKGSSVGDVRSQLRSGEKTDESHDGDKGTTGGLVRSKHKPCTVKDNTQERKPNEVVLTDLPRNISESDVVYLVREECHGFVDAVLASGRCSLKFKRREDAMEAVCKLYGKPISGHCIKPVLSWHNEEVEPHIAKKVLKDLKEREMPEKVFEIKHRIKEECKVINSDLSDCRDAFKENLSYAEIQRYEISIETHEHHLEEKQRFLDEFNNACLNIETALEGLEPKTQTLSEVHKIRHQFLRECRRLDSPLPVYGYRSRIEEAMRRNKAVVLQGETGSGKSTQIPQYLVDMALESQEDEGSSQRPQWRVVCTQPRRVAALTLSKRVAEEYGCQVSEEVGYFVGNKKSVSAKTVVTFMTDRKLLNLIIADPNLSDYTCVIVDEAHERSVDTDILLATLKKLLRTRKDLHLLIMSATIDTTLFSKYLSECKEIKVPGRTFPVDKQWIGDDVSIGEGDYVGKAVKQTAKVHRDEKEGDILVFLTSANEIEQACRDLSTSLGQRPDDQDKEALILPLHGRLQPEDQMKVFADAKAGQRKIIFATNVAETSVTIKGIRYVIDTGVVKECQYDPKRSMSLLKVTTITQASAQQRAGRAGRTGPGVCYRLYTKEEYNDLNEMMKPEILRVHLGMAALQLLELGVEDVANFDFIQAPDREATQQAMTTLRLLGAVDAADKLTSLGRKMATFPMEPRLSKLILEGVEKHLTSEAVIIAALISAPGSVFYRGGSDKDKEKADRLKLKYCHDSGDVITMLKAYGSWNSQAAAKQKAWCMENSMNSKTLRAVRESANEAAQVLKLKHNIECNARDYKMEAIDATKTESLQKIIMSAYFQTLSLYNGHPRAGYTVLPHQKSGFIHPSSSLVALDCNPKWVVYEEFKQTSRSFLFNVTQVNIDWLQEVAPMFYDEIDVDALHEMALQEAPAIQLGTAVMRRLTMKRNEKVRAMEEFITEAKGSPCIIQVNRATKELQMFMKMNICEFATSYVEIILKEELVSIQREQIEVPVGESGVVRQVVVAGGQTKYIMMPNDYRSLEVSYVTEDMSEDDLKRMICLSSYCTQEEILDVYKFQKQTTAKWGRVTFSSPETAEETKMSLEVEDTLQLKPILGRSFQNRDIARVSSRIVVIWYTWPSKGHAFINFDTSNQALEMKESLQHFDFKGKQVECQLKRNNTRALYLQRVHKDATNEELEEAIEDYTDCKKVKCSIARQPPAISITDNQVTQDIYKMFEGTLREDQLDINILLARSEKTQSRKAIVNFECDNEDEVDACILNIQDNPPRNSAGQIYIVKLTASCMLFCNPDVYVCIEQRITKLVEEVREGVRNLNVRVNKSKKTSDWVINVAGENIQEVHRTRRELLSYIRGETVSLNDLCEEEVSFQIKYHILKLLHKNGLRHLTYGLEAHAMVDTRRHLIVIYGKDEVREVLKEQVKNYINIICKNKLKEISLTAGLSEGCTKGRAIRALVRAYGPWLKKLVEETGAEAITLNMRQGNLLIEGDQNVFDNAHKMVRNCLQEAGQQAAIRVGGDDATTEVECGICYTAVEATEEVYRLSACSHGFHLQCLHEMFTVRLQNASKDYPIECPCEGCGLPMLLCDFRVLCSDETKRRRLFDLALESHVTQKSEGKLKFCPTPDCHMIYKTTKDAGVFLCPECRNRLCSSCGSEPHMGYTCVEFKASGKNFDDLAFEKWIKRKDVKRCPVPNCGIPIEKNGGCFHIKCRECKKHICWHCLEFFDRSKMCYDHLSEKHGGFF
ncbi:ATP-dependent RNA helicase DEAH12, chloroplastic-like isoform X1 [Asterias rubens]|uniref:ATP-dependent RNA helicase DEAH12, chloroplastic-like isoform X1 n=1 Tax=Asterias rubens TaxID=7604 RepID=UPI001455DA83|nr:ATP-dependent RNA helicase DEAH12, chloroplastic-like isoform X1 [Asterias rubens]